MRTSFVKISCFSGNHEGKKTARILIITGTHGADTGESGLTDIDSLDQTFYKEDCKSVGVQPGREIKRGEFFVGSQDVSRPLEDSEFHPKDREIFDIKKPAKKLHPDELKRLPGCYYNDPQLKEMDFRLADMSFYHKRGDRLVQDIEVESFIKQIYTNLLPKNAYQSWFYLQN